MRVAVVGTGGTGGYFGGLLARAGEDVTFIARSKHLEAIREHGLTVKSRLVGDFTLRVPATSDTKHIGPVDLILFCVKAYDNATAIELLPPLVGSETMVLSLQNGVDNEEQIAQAIGDRPVVGAVSFVTCMIEAPGIVAQTAGLGKIIMGELAGGISPRLEHLRDAFERAQIVAQVHQDIKTAIWEKFLFICGFSGVTALTRLPIGTIIETPQTYMLLKGVMEEVYEVARAHGIAVAEGCVEQSVSTLARWEPWGHGSLYFDLANSKHLELDALNGAVVRLGEQHGVPTPLNFAIYASLKPFINGAPALKQ
jgi:2-dehydropantoate 2-reductase